MFVFKQLFTFLKCAVPYKEFVIEDEIVTKKGIKLKTNNKIFTETKAENKIVTETNNKDKIVTEDKTKSKSKK